MASFKVTLDNTIVAVMTQYAEQVRADLIQRLADKYEFDATEAMAFIQSGGIVVKYPPLDREKLPWTGNVRPECCKAIKKNSGLFTQCNGIVHTDDWCKPCAKEVAKKGKPTCGTVQDRLAADVLDYQVGPFKVKPYVEYMKKHGIAREQVDKACDDYDIEIDPRQFEVKKRPRKPRDMASAVDAMAPSFDAFAEQDEEDAMTATTGLDPTEQLESDDEDDFEGPGTGITVATHGPTVLSVVEVTEPTATTEPTPEPAPSPVELSPEPTVTALPTEATKPTTAPTATITAEQVSTMDKKTVTAHCKARGIDTENKGVVQLKRELTASISKGNTGTTGGEP
jgi:hypothetical protein